MEVSLVERGLIFKILALILIFTFFLEAEQTSDNVQIAVAPYLLPDNHLIKPALDALFSSSRVILNLDTLEEAGFTKTKPRKFTKLIVTSHPDFPGYIFKLYLDSQRYYKDLPEHHYWILRAKGVKKIRREISARELETLFKTPHKWIYALPQHPRPPEGYYTKQYILVEEDMDLLSDEENKALWASDAVTTEVLDHLFAILNKIGLRDCAKPDNIPFSRDGRIAFIDTQTFGIKNVRYEKLNDYLSKPNQAYWKMITDQ